MHLSFCPKLPAWLLGAALLASAAAAPCAAAVRSGLLDCNVSPGIGFIITSSRALACVYHPRHGRPERYVGTIRQFGLAIGITGPSRFVWGVVTAAPRGAPYPLAGEYAGVGAAATVGAGLSANALIGGNARSVTLQPVSVGVQTGLALSAGVGALLLEPAP
jgi:hypothetical protein